MIALHAFDSIIFFVSYTVRDCEIVGGLKIKCHLKKKKKKRFLFRKGKSHWRVGALALSRVTIKCI